MANAVQDTAKGAAVNLLVNAVGAVISADEDIARFVGGLLGGVLLILPGDPDGLGRSPNAHSDAVIQRPWNWLISGCPDSCSYVRLPRLPRSGRPVSCAFQRRLPRQIWW